MFSPYYFCPSSNNKMERRQFSEEESLLSKDMRRIEAVRMCINGGWSKFKSDRALEVVLESLTGDYNEYKNGVVRGHGQDLKRRSRHALKFLGHWQGKDSPFKRLSCQISLI